MDGPTAQRGPTTVADEALSLPDVTATSNPVARRTSSARPSSIPLGSIAQQAQTDLARSYAEYRLMLASAGMTEQEFGILVRYIRETSELNKEMKRQNKPEIHLSETDLEQRILATRQQTPRFPGTIDLKGHNIGIIPRTEITGEFVGTGMAELVQFLQDHPDVALSLFLDFVPVIGEFKAGIEAIIGRDLITGEEIPTWARVLGAAIVAIPAAKGLWKLASLSARVARRAGSMVRKLAPIALVAALSYKAPAEALRLMKNTAELDETAVKLAKIEAEATATGVLHATELQEKAAQEMSKLLTAEEVAELERTATRESVKPVPDVPAPPAKKLPDTPEALPVGEHGKGSAPRKPKGKPRPAPRPKKKPTAAAAGRRPRRLQAPFMKEMLEKIISNKKHRLRGLIDPKNQRWLARSHLSKLPTVQAGHLVSFHSGAPEALALEDSLFNQFSNWKGERYGSVFEKGAVDIDGCPVEIRTAMMLESVGLLEKGTVKSAMRSAGWTGKP